MVGRPSSAILVRHPTARFQFSIPSREPFGDVIAGSPAVPPSVLRTEPDGFVWFTLGDDRRLMTLFIDDGVRTSLTNLGLEKRLNLNDLLTAGNEAMQLSRKQFSTACPMSRKRTVRP